MTQIIVATEKITRAATSPAPWSISPKVRQRMASRILMPLRFRPDRVLRRIAGIGFPMWRSIRQEPYTGRCDTRERNSPYAEESEMDVIARGLDHDLLHATFHRVSSMLLGII